MTEWSYQKAFRRNLGLIDSEEQQILRRSRISIVGQGGVGGVHLTTLARLGVGKFTIADPDTFENVNFNRQAGATISSLGKSKTEVMSRIVKDINPEIDLREFKDPINESNADAFLKGADLFIDGIDAFEIEVRRILFRKAAEKGIYGITAAPIGFGTAWIVFDPKGMSFDRYFDLTDDMDPVEKVASFFIGLVPKTLHRSYMDYAFLNIETQAGPSASAACQMAAGVASTEAVKILLKRGTIRSAPHYHQFDAFTGKFTSGRLQGGNRNLVQRLKRKVLTPKLRAGFD